jgi:hypothetical protein
MFCDGNARRQAVVPARRAATITLPGGSDLGRPSVRCKLVDVIVQILSHDEGRDEGCGHHHDAGASAETVDARPCRTETCGATGAGTRRDHCILRHVCNLANAWIAPPVPPAAELLSPRVMLNGPACLIASA